MHTAEFTSALPRLLAFPVPRLVESALEWILGLREIGSLYAALRSMGEDRPIAERLLQHLGTTYRVADRTWLESLGRDRGRRGQPSFGILDAAARDGSRRYGRP
jgi:hypothetical protein